MSRKKKAKGPNVSPSSGARTPQVTGETVKTVNLASARSDTPPTPATRRKLWLFRLLAAVVVPSVCLLVIEFGLRLSGFGYPTSFLISRPTSSSQNSNAPAFQSAEAWVQNNRFGWRFFGRQLARTPAPFSIPEHKAPNTIRIFVFGESAAFGDPQPQFGLPRMIEALLSLRHSGVRFEVVNAAMIGINSHAVLPIARDCARAGGDVAGRSHRLLLKTATFFLTAAETALCRRREGTRRRLTCLNWLLVRVR